MYYSDYEIVTGTDINALLDDGWTIAPDGLLLPPGVIDQQPEPETVDIVDMIDAWKQGEVRE